MTVLYCRRGPTMIHEFCSLAISMGTILVPTRIQVVHACCKLQVYQTTLQKDLFWFTEDTGVTHFLPLHYRLHFRNLKINQQSPVSTHSCCMPQARFSNGPLSFSLLMDNFANIILFILYRYVQCLQHLILQQKHY